MGTHSPNFLKIDKCPSCANGPIDVEDKPQQHYCPHCKAEIYPTDSLRLWEEIFDYQSNVTAITRLMLVIEHLMSLHYIRHIAENDALDTLSQTAFFIDGPLSIFGPSAWLHLAIMRYLTEIKCSTKR